MNRGNNAMSLFGISSPILFSICAIAFALIGLFTFRDYGDGSWFCRTDWFWFRIAWFEVILATAWFAIFGVPFKLLLNHRLTSGATYAIVTSILLRAAVISFLIWSVSAFIPIEIHWAKLPVAVQIVVALYYGIIACMLPKTQTLQSDGLEKPSDSAISVDELVNLLREFEKRCKDHRIDARSVKRVREKIQFSLPRGGNISKSEKYTMLSNQISAIAANDVSTGIKAIADTEAMINNVIEECKIRI